MNLISQKKIGKMEHPRNDAPDRRFELAMFESDGLQYPTTKRFLFGFSNGLYNIDSDMFYPYTEEENWSKMADNITLFRRENGWGDSYTAVPPTSNDVAVTYLPHGFRFDITPDTEKTFNPNDIVLNALDDILVPQHFDESTRRWILLMLCRLFFPVGYDSWQVMLFIKTVAGSGENPLAKFIQSFYDPSDVTTLSNRLSDIYTSLLCIGVDVGHELGFGLGQWLSAVSGEELSITEDHTAFARKWDTPMFMLAHKLPFTPCEPVNRRVFMIEFAHTILYPNLNMNAQLENDMDRFLRKGVSLYHAARREYSDTAISDILMNFQPTDCLDSFLGDKTLFKLDPSAFMKMSDFRDMYMAYRKEQGHPLQRWSRDVYSQGFQLHGIVAKPTPETRIYRHNTSTDYWINGIDHLI